MRVQASAFVGRAVLAALGLVAAAICLGLVTATRAQNRGAAVAQNPVQTLKVTTEVVNVYAVVRQKKRGLIPNLNRENFLLFEDDKPQEIRYFSRETDTPLTMGIAIDTSVSQGRVLGVEQEEAKRFLHQVMRPEKDLTFVLNFDLEVTLLQELTGDLRRLAQAIDDTEIRGAPSGPLPAPVPTSSVGGTHLHDAVYLAANEILKGEVGRKVLILLSDGVDDGSFYKQGTALEAAQKANLIIYAVNVNDPFFYLQRGMGFRGTPVLKDYAEETGGRVIKVQRPEKTAAAFREIADELRTQYLLGYTPSNTGRDGAYRKIRVKIRGGKYNVQARDGYYAPRE